jgi:hypothetical protein
MWSRVVVSGDAGWVEEIILQIFFAVIFYYAICFYISRVLRLLGIS